MKYKDLKEMNIKDWDGQPFRAIVVDIEDSELYATDIVLMNEGVIENAVLITGYNNGRWYDDDGVGWSHVYPMEWNRKPKKRMTYRQLSMWLAKGNGVLWKSECNHIEFTSYNYVTKYADAEVRDDWKVRKWDSEEWTEPTTDLLEDC